jgi:uncharacterized protein (TIGR02147 family)
MTPERALVVDLLKTEMVQRQERNSAYSLRAFARDLGTSAAVLSMVLQGKRPVSSEKAISWADRLKFPSEKRQQLLKAVTEDLHGRLDPTIRRTRAMEEKMAYMQLQIDQFAIISDWWHFGLMNLVKLKNFQSDIAWMSERLGISADECSEALDRLQRMGLMECTDGTWSRTARPLETPTDLPSEAIRSFHRQNIRRALSSIDDVSIEERDITSIMITTDKAKLEEAKKRIRLFRKELAAFLGESQGDEVYSLNIQLFPQTGRKS